MNGFQSIFELNEHQIDAVSGADQSHYDAGKALADSIQSATHNVLEWFRERF